MHAGLEEKNHIGAGFPIRVIRVIRGSSAPAGWFSGGG